ncbi:MAG TPA: FAD:protein FMN transferase [Kiritimatiellia bacterium]|nr:FAD:protein FMN transferase [Kiritimatiellia bacterium]
MRPTILTSLFSLTVILMSGCKPKLETHATFITNGHTGTVYTISTHARELPHVAGILRKNVDMVTSALADRQPDNELARLNRIGDTVRMPISQLTFRAIDLARHYSELTDGLFDVTTGDIAALWARGIPADDILQEHLSRIGTRFIETSDNNTIAFLSPGIKITAGLLAAAYAVDVGIVDMRRSNSGPFLFNLNTFARREGQFPPPGDALLPLAPAGFPTLGNINLKEHRSLAAVSLNQATPGTNARPFIVRIDPRAGTPASGALAVAVAGPLTIKAYTLAEALLVAGPGPEGEALMRRFEEYDALLITMASPMIVYATEGFMNVFQPAPDINIDMRTWKIKDEASASLSGILQIGQPGTPFIESFSHDSADEIFMPESD